MAKNGEKKIQTKTIDNEDLTVYYNDLKRYKPLNYQEERDLLLRYKNKNDLVARQKLITSNLRYAFSLVNKYKGGGVSLSDLIEEANIGLIKGIDKYDINYNVKVITYAKWDIIDCIEKAIERNNKIEKTNLPEEYEQQISNEAEFSNEYNNNDYMNTAFVSEDKESEKINAINDVESIIKVLDERETDFIKMYYGIKPYDKEYTYQEIGNKYNITKERVRQIINKIMRKLRTQALIFLKK